MCESWVMSSDGHAPVFGDALSWRHEAPHVLLREIVKKRSFYSQADRKGYGQADGKGGSAPSALTVSKCENFGPIFPIIKW